MNMIIWGAKTFFKVPHESNDNYFTTQVGKSACIVLAKERHSKGERVPFSAYTPKYTKLKPEAASTLSLMFQIFLEKNYRTPCPALLDFDYELLIKRQFVHIIRYFILNFL